MNKSRFQANIRAPQAAVHVLILLLTFMPFGSLSASTAYNVVIITSSDSNYQTYIATNIRDELEITGTKAIILSADDIDSALQNLKTLFVAIGERAIDSLHAFNKDAMVLRVSSRKLAGKDYTSIQSDLLTSQPDCRHIQLIKSINRDWNTVAVLSGIDSIDIAAALTKCSITHNTNLKVYAITDNSDLLVTLEAAIEDNKVLLAISDPLIYNAHSVKNILLTAYRQRKPVIGYSESFVQAGAIAAIYTPPEFISDRAVEIITGFFNNNWQFDRNIYRIDRFDISLNTQVANSLDTVLPDEDFIRTSIERMENKQ